MDPDLIHSEMRSLIMFVGYFLLQKKKNGYEVNHPLPVNNVTQNIFTIY